MVDDVDGKLRGTGIAGLRVFTEKGFRFED